jgi:hypothetical protein
MSGRFRKASYILAIIALLLAAPAVIATDVYVGFLTWSYFTVLNRTCDYVAARALQSDGELGRVRIVPERLPTERLIPAQGQNQTLPVR